MLDAVVVLIVVLLVASGVLVMLGPSAVVRGLSSVRRPRGIKALFEPHRPREVAAPALNPKTQRVLVAASRLDDPARELRNAAARMTANEPAGLYALQTTLRRIRVVNVTDSASQERLKTLVSELRSAVQDRFEQLELLPFRRP